MGVPYHNVLENVKTNDFEMFSINFAMTDVPNSKILGQPNMYLIGFDE